MVLEKTVCNLMINGKTRTTSLLISVLGGFEDELCRRDTGSCVARSSSVYGLRRLDLPECSAQSYP